MRLLPWRRSGLDRWADLVAAEPDQVSTEAAAVAEQWRAEAVRLAALTETTALLPAHGLRIPLYLSDGGEQW